ncbi:hypothetical protein ACJJTC_017139 [Scirpophaga incertulas]
MIVLLLVTAFLISFTQQHYILSNHPCFSAYTCNHTWHPVCASDEIVHDTRLFIDECHVSEYNCLYKKRYVKVNITQCQDCGQEDNAPFLIVSTLTTTASTSGSTARTVITTRNNSSNITTITITTETPSILSTPTASPAVPTTIATLRTTISKPKACGYPEHCDRPRNWETTTNGETRDFFQILKKRYGRRAVLMKDTTHWPMRSSIFLKDTVKNKHYFGHHYDVT